MKPASLSVAVKRSDLDVGSGLVGDLHDELAAAVGRLAHQVVQDEEVDGGAQVVDVGHEDVLLPLSDEFVQQSRVGEAGVDVSVTRRVPGIRVLAAHPHVLSYRQQGLLVDPRIPARTTVDRWSVRTDVTREQLKHRELLIDI